jgi:hypothetical protein
MGEYERVEGSLLSKCAYENGGNVGPKMEYGETNKIKCRLTIGRSEGGAPTGSTDIDLALEHRCDSKESSEDLLLDSDGEIVPVVICLLK